MRDVVFPYLRELGERWLRGETSIAQEHFASALLRGRLLGLARSWGAGDRPRALLACPPGEQHDLGLIGFGLALHDHGWRITFLGTDTPLATIAATAGRMHPVLVVLSTTLAQGAATAEEGLKALAPGARRSRSRPGDRAEGRGALPAGGSRDLGREGCRRQRGTPLASVHAR